jgi:type II secretory ATPase GspE/PulE/Tfp pilus assembly ATPase PilB-like protein
MVVNEPIRRAITDGSPVDRVNELAIDGGMRTLRDAMLELVAHNESSVAELKRVMAGEFM